MLAAQVEARRSELASRYDELAEQHNGTGEDLPDDVAAELHRRWCTSSRRAR